MPTYEYRCNECGFKFERFHSIKADPIRDCPECGKKGAVQRLISGGAGLIFKGDGFYITDYRSDSYKSAQKKEKAASSGSSAKSAEKSGKGDSKKTSGSESGSSSS